MNPTFKRNAVLKKIFIYILYRVLSCMQTTWKFEFYQSDIILKLQNIQTFDNNKIKLYFQTY